MQEDDSTFIGFVIKILPEALQEKTDSRILHAITAAIYTVAEKLTPEDIRQVLAQLLPAIRQTVNPERLNLLAATIRKIAGKLTPEDAQQVLTRLAAAIRATMHTGQLRALARALQAVPGALTSEDAQQVLTQILRDFSERLLERVEAKGRELGCCKLTLEVRADNHPAQRLYQHVGFQHIEYGGEATRMWFLEKRL
jgi:uncharacterized protein (DUF2267 family)